MIFLSQRRVLDPAIFQVKGLSITGPFDFYFKSRKMKPLLSNWCNVQNFVQKKISMPEFGIIVIGYFPYHTANIDKNVGRVSMLLPRKLFSAFELLLEENGIIENKAVFICVPCDEISAMFDCFAIMVKDSWAVIGPWASVTDYDGNPLRKIKKSKTKSNGKSKNV